MKNLCVIAVMLFAFLLTASIALADQWQVYGKIYTYDDEVFEGPIRWDKNEGAWCDVFDGTKFLEHRDKKRTRHDRDKRDRRIKIFGVTVYTDDEYDWNWNATSAQSGIQMGHIKSLIPDGDDEVILVLKSGEEVELENGSTDFGDDVREILIDDIKEGVVELYWDDIDRIDFMQGKGISEEFGKHLYGTVTTRRGDEFTGFIGWDVDEIYDLDILDGSERNRKRKIEFGKIEMIERISSNSAEVTLKSGKKMRLSDSNDIDSGNRGIAIADQNLGRVNVEWDDFDYIVFTDPPGQPSYDDYDGGKRIRGTVYTADDESFTGDIRWDDDEEYTWEFLDGYDHDIEFDIEFTFIDKIERSSYRSSRVTLKDGREFKLRGSNDIDGDNKGIFIFTDDGDEIIVDWDEFDRVEFSH